jgi:peptidoglycan/LPS O-acetylase OafA/YrhL
MMYSYASKPHFRNRKAQRLVASGSSVPAQVYFRPLDGLRFLCCSSVIVGHSLLGNLAAGPFALGISRMGVDIFFSLSGFLITTLLLREKNLLGSVSLYQFYMRRTLRIWPVYFVALALNIALLVIFKERFLRFFGASAPHLPALKVALVYALFIGNWVLYGVTTTMAIFWSICVEEQFYIFFPITFVRSKQKYPVLISGLVGLAVCTITRALFVNSADPHTIYVNTITHGDNLLMGALLAQTFSAAPTLTRDIFRKKSVLLLLSLVAVPAYYAWLERVQLRGAALTFQYSLSAIFSTVVVGLFAFSEGLLSRFFGSGPLVFLGSLTYGAYIFHEFAVSFSWGVMKRVVHNPDLAGLLRWTIAIPATYVIAYLVKITFEQRILDLKKKFSPLPTAPVQSAAAATAS